MNKKLTDATSIDSIEQMYDVNWCCSFGLWRQLEDTIAIASAALSHVCVCVCLCVQCLCLALEPEALQDFEAHAGMQADYP